MSEEQEQLVTRRQAAIAAGVTYNTIQLWIRAGRLHPVVPPGMGQPSISWTELTKVMGKSLAAESSALWASKRPYSNDGATATG